MTDVLATADGADKAALYKQLGVSLTYHHERRVTVEALPRGVQVRVGRGLASRRDAVRLTHTVSLAA